MGGSAKKTETTTQSSQTQPWQQAQPLLQGILDQSNTMLGTTGPNSTQQSAIDQLTQNAQSSPDFTPQATALTGDLFNGGTDRTGMVNSTYSDLQRRLSSAADGANIGPNGNPALKGYLDTIANDVGNSVNSQFAAAGRDLSGLNVQALGRGIAQGQAPILAQQYNTDVANQMGAANTLYGAGINTAQQLSGLDQQRFANRSAGFGIAQQFPALQNQNANQLLQAGSIGTGIQQQNLGFLGQLGTSIGSLGQQSNGTGTNTTTQSQPLGSTILGGLLGGVGTLGRIGAFGPTGFLSGTFR